MVRADRKWPLRESKNEYVYPQNPIQARSIRQPYKIIVSPVRLYAIIFKDQTKVRQKITIESPETCTSKSLLGIRSNPVSH